jgi:hypothetical protein
MWSPIRNRPSWSQRDRELAEEHRQHCAAEVLAGPITVCPTQPVIF